MILLKVRRTINLYILILSVLGFFMLYFEIHSEKVVYPQLGIVLASFIEEVFIKKPCSEKDE
jgi:hypothetical protein